MSYIGNSPTSIAFLTDLFTGTGSLTTFTMSAAPASTSSILVSITGIVQEPSTYAVSGNTLTFSQAPPAGTGNVSVRYLGIPASNIVSTAYRTVTEFTATLAQTIFTVPSYTVGYITVYRNGARLGTADYTASSGTNVILTVAANTGDLVTTESFYVSSVLNAIPAVAGAVTSAYILDGAVGSAEIASGVTLTSPVLGTPASGSLENCTGVQYNGFKNRIINGGMDIDQRNAGGSLTITANPQYILDRWFAGVTTASKISVQQNAGAVTPPVGFTKYLGVTSLAATSLAATDLYYLQQSIEGFNIADLGFGTASASPVTISFRVYSSLTGTFGAVLLNAGSNRSYPFNFSIPITNTWTTITQTIAGDTTGTWSTDNTTGFNLRFGLGAGSTYSGTAGAWGTANVVTTTGATSVVGTSGATFYITGVQLEKGSVATSFDYRPYGTELSLCQRYYEKSYNTNDVPATATAAGSANGSRQTGSGVAYVKHAVVKRASPTVTVYSPATGTSGQVRNAATGADEAGAAGNIGDSGFNVTPTTSTISQSYFFQWVSAIEL